MFSLATLFRDSACSACWVRPRRTACFVLSEDRLISFFPQVGKPRLGLHPGPRACRQRLSGTSSQQPGRTVTIATRPRCSACPSVGTVSEPWLVKCAILSVTGHSLKNMTRLPLCLSGWTALPPGPQTATCRGRSAFLQRNAEQAAATRSASYPNRFFTGQ